MLDVIIDTLLDSIKLIPFLFLSYLLIEYIEHKSSKDLGKILTKSGKFGPSVGAILGLVPQCGFSVTASNLYAGRVITLGTLIAVFISTSDEAIPVLLSHPENYMDILKIISVKFIVAIISATIIDLIFRKKHTLNKDIKDVREHMHEICSNCECEHKGHILKPTIKHTINTFIFIIIVAFILNTAVYLIGEDNLSKLLMNGNILQPFISGIIGLIPNCASSVLLTELYISGNLSFASIIAGLCTGAGIGLAVLFKVNSNMKENIKILGLVYLIGCFAGLLIELIDIF